MPSLLIGCGHSRLKRVYLDGNKEWAEPLITIDMNPDCGADFVRDAGFFYVDKRECVAPRHMPFEDDAFDEIGAYDVLEHWGAQGDWKSWFTEMAEYHRVLKPGGLMGILVPANDDALADPGHTRFFGPNHFRMLEQSFYERAIEKGLPITDYRWYWTRNFEVLNLEPVEDHHIACVLKKA